MGQDDTTRIRLADEPTLWLMLTYAATMTPPGEPAIPLVKADPYLRTYVDGWGARGDLGVVAIRGAERVGAAWIRLGADGGRYKLSDPRVPELAMAVLPDARRQGIGTVMMRRLVVLATGVYPAITLSVRETNPAMAFYQRFGFVETGRMENRAGGTSLVMRLDLPHAAAAKPPGMPE